MTYNSDYCAYNKSWGWWATKFLSGESAVLESAFNSIVSRSLSLKESSFGYKIADTFSSGGARSLSPFDGFGVYVSETGKGYPVYWESKSLKEPKSFPLTRLEDHQINYLIKLYNALGEDALCLFLICVDFGRADKRVFVWKNKDLLYIKERKDQKKNILKKEFETLNNFIRVERSTIDFQKILEM